MEEKKVTPVFKNLAEPALVDMLLSGAVGVLLTDTVYGVVGSALNPNAAGSVIDAKGRKFKPGTLIAANVNQLLDLGVKRQHIQAAEHFWPGAVSVVLPTGTKLHYLHLGKMSLPVRIPDKPDLLQLLEKVGPLLTTSANRPNEPMVKTIAEAIDIFGDRIDFYVDGGKVSSPIASTIVRIQNNTIHVLRQGAVEIKFSRSRRPTGDEPR